MRSKYENYSIDLRWLLVTGRTDIGSFIHQVSPVTMRTQLGDGQEDRKNNALHWRLTVYQKEAL